MISASVFYTRLGLICVNTYLNSPIVSYRIVLSSILLLMISVTKYCCRPREFIEVLLLTMMTDERWRRLGVRGHHSGAGLSLSAYLSLYLSVSFSLCLSPLRFHSFACHYREDCPGRQPNVSAAIDPNAWLIRCDWCSQPGVDWPQCISDVLRLVYYDCSLRARVRRQHSICMHQCDDDWRHTLTQNI